MCPYEGEKPYVVTLVLRKEGEEEVLATKRARLFPSEGDAFLYLADIKAREILMDAQWFAGKT
jgi:hypothetical protein